MLFNLSHYINKPDWEVYDFILNGNVINDGITTVKKVKRGWHWKTVWKSSYRYNGNEFNVICILFVQSFFITKVPSKGMLLITSLPKQYLTFTADQSETACGSIFSG